MTKMQKFINLEYIKHEKARFFNIFFSELVRMIITPQITPAYCFP